MGQYEIWSVIISCYKINDYINELLLYQKVWDRFQTQDPRRWNPAVLLQHALVGPIDVEDGLKHFHDVILHFEGVILYSEDVIETYTGRHLHDEHLHDVTSTF